MHLSINLAFAIAGLLQTITIIIAIWLLSKATPRSKYLLLAYLVVLSLQILVKGLSKIWVMSNLGFLSILAYELPFLYGPLVYLYIASVVTPGKLSVKQSVIPLVPFLLYFLLLLCFVLFPNNNFIISLLPNSLAKRMLHAALMIAVAVFYCIKAQKMLKHYEPKAMMVSGDPDKVKLPWLQQLNIANLCVGLVIIIALELMYNFYPSLTEVRYLFLSLTIFICGIL